MRAHTLGSSDLWGQRVGCAGRGSSREIDTTGGCGSLYPQPPKGSTEGRPRKARVSGPHRPPFELCPSRTASRGTDASRDPGRSVTRSSLTAAKWQGVATRPPAPPVGPPRPLGPARLRPAHPGHAAPPTLALSVSSPPAPASRPRPLGRLRWGRPAHPARLRWGRPARPASPALPAASGRVSSVPHRGWLRRRRRRCKF